MEDFKDISSMLFKKIIGWGETTVLMLPNFIMAIVVIVAITLIARLIRKAMRNLMSKTSENKAINNLITTIIYVGFIVVGIFVALGVLDLDKTVTSLLAGVGVVGLALGFAFQNTASNFISGVLMASKFPLAVGDLVSSNEHFGKVVEIGLRYTTMRSFQGQMIVIPNKEILENSLTNYTTTGERRVDVECGVGYGSDLEQVEKTAIEAMNGLYNSDKPVELMYHTFADSSINFTLRFWLNNNSHKDYLMSKSDAVKAIKKAFDAKGINIPFPIRTLEFRPKQLQSVIEATHTRDVQSVTNNIKQ